MSSPKEHTLANCGGKGIYTVFGVMTSLFLYFCFSSTQLNYYLSLSLIFSLTYFLGFKNQGSSSLKDSQLLPLDIDCAYNMLSCNPSRMAMVGRILRRAPDDPSP